MSIKLSAEVQKRITKENYYSETDFVNDAKAYIAAVKSGRILYTVASVSKSGISRNISVKSFEGKMTEGYYRDYIGFLRALGYKIDGFGSVKIPGCGMNMLFATNHNIIHALHRMGFMTKKVCAVLAQKVR